VKPVSLLAVPHLVCRPSSIELGTAFTEAEQRTTAGQERQRVRGEICAQLLDDPSMDRDCDGTVIGNENAKASGRSRAGCGSRCLVPRPIEAHQGAIVLDRRRRRLDRSIRNGQEEYADGDRADVLHGNREAHRIEADERACRQGALEQRAAGELHPSSPAAEQPHVVDGART
jgi:hypothetical protein